jgi:DNA-directed RNA polymerase specialized sigma24 family protein
VTRVDDEFRRFALARFKQMVRAAVLLGCSPVEAEDAAQDALVRCFVAWRRVSTADDPGAYAYRVLVNGIRRGRRRRWRGELPHAVLPEGTPEADPGDGVSLGLTVPTGMRATYPESPVEFRIRADAATGVVDQDARARSRAPGRRVPA